MDPIHIHNLLRQLSSEVHCPHCDAKVWPNMITVENSNQNYCLLRIECHACGEIFHGHAHVGVKVSPLTGPGNTLKNDSQLLNSLPPSPLPISETDLTTLKTSLSQAQEASSMKDLFSSHAQ